MHDLGIDDRVSSRAVNFDEIGELITDKSGHFAIEKSFIRLIELRNDELTFSSGVHIVDVIYHSKLVV